MAPVMIADRPVQASETHAFQTYAGIHSGLSQGLRVLEADLFDGNAMLAVDTTLVAPLPVEKVRVGAEEEEIHAKTRKKLRCSELPYT